MLAFQASYTPLLEDTRQRRPMVPRLRLDECVPVFGAYRRIFDGYRRCFVQGKEILEEQSWKRLSHEEDCHNICSIHLYVDKSLYDIHNRASKTSFILHFSHKFEEVLYLSLLILPLFRPSIRWAEFYHVLFATFVKAKNHAEVEFHLPSNMDVYISQNQTLLKYSCTIST